MADNLPPLLANPLPDCPEVEAQAIKAEAAGERPLWEGYSEVANYARSTQDGRSSEQVRTASEIGKFYALLTQRLAPDIIVEFGTAFGVSGMFWLTGLERAGKGRLMTYEPNAAWAAIARSSLEAISQRFTLTDGTFEEHAAATLQPGTVGLAFIDAIHTEEFVMGQWAVLKPFMKPGGIVIFDDIDFSDSMRSCWAKVSVLPEVRASLTINPRVGIVELV